MAAMNLILDRLLPGHPPTVRDLVLANIHIHSVLPRLADLVRLDDEARQIAANMNMALEFRVLGGPHGVLIFKNGTVTASRTASSNAGLLFPSCSALNRMFAGEKVTPIPFKGLHHFKDLKQFEKLSNRLTVYLKPSDEDMKSAEFRAKHVELSLLVGLAATAEIAAYDPRAQRVTEALHDGTMQYAVGGGAKAWVKIQHHGIEVGPGEIKDPSTTVEIADVDLALAIMAGRVDTFACNGSGRIKASGNLHLADEFNHLFERVGLYLQ